MNEQKRMIFGEGQLPPDTPSWIKAVSDEQEIVTGNSSERITFGDRRNESTQNALLRIWSESKNILRVHQGEEKRNFPSLADGDFTIVQQAVGRNTCFLAALQHLFMHSGAIDPKIIAEAIFRKAEEEAVGQNIASDQYRPLVDLKRHLINQLSLQGLLSEDLYGVVSNSEENIIPLRKFIAREARTLETSGYSRETIGRVEVRPAQRGAVGLVNQMVKDLLSEKNLIYSVHIPWNSVEHGHQIVVGGISVGSNLEEEEPRFYITSSLPMELTGERGRKERQHNGWLTLTEMYQLLESTGGGEFHLVAEKPEERRAGKGQARKEPRITWKSDDDRIIWGGEDPGLADLTEELKEKFIPIERMRFGENDRLEKDEEIVLGKMEKGSVFFMLAKCLCEIREIEVEGQRKTVLVVHNRLSENKAQAVFDLSNTQTNGRVQIGRADSDIKLNDFDQVSRRHAEIWRDEQGNWHLKDLGSTNGTQVNREWLKRRAELEKKVKTLDHGSYQAAGLTDEGLVREHNEDSFGVNPLGDEKLGDERPLLLVVADGMGGHEAGEVASEAAVNNLTRGLGEKLSAIDSENIVETLREAVKTANSAVNLHPKRVVDGKDMGTTLAAAVVDRQGKLTVANVGDSRVYILRDSVLRQITQDHSWVEEQVRAGDITRDEARNHAYRNVITRSLGSKEDVEVDIFEKQLLPGDWVLLCSDGLTGRVEDEEIKRIIFEAASPEDACQRLIEAANSAGGADNITAIVLKNENYEDIEALLNKLKEKLPAMTEEEMVKTASRLAFAISQEQGGLADIHKAFFTKAFMNENYGQKLVQALKKSCVEAANRLFSSDDDDKVIRAVLEAYEQLLELTPEAEEDKILAVVKKCLRR